MIAELEKSFGVKILPIRIIGKRWAFKGENLPIELPVATSHRIILSDSEGVIVYGWDDLDEKQKHYLTIGLKEHTRD
ncbi:MAG: hypothetical protein ACOCW2_04590 [Chitinivibrionales bacterium]